MAIQRTLKHVDGLKELDAMLDSLIDPKFRARALRNAGRNAMRPVRASLESKLPEGKEDIDDPHYESSYGKGYKSGDLKKGVRLSVTVNTEKAIKVTKSGNVKDKQRAELYVNLGFKPHLIKLASILENGRQKRAAKTSMGKVFHYYGHKTDMVVRDIGTTAPKHFISSTFAEQESLIVERFKTDLTKSIQRQAKAMAKKK
ncbi:hypothetical protein KGV31_002167 [Vibrio parahaemolyticus]|nr:hypothetical protein [Vibrio parahaemolyticus]EHU0344310.1 hypothetical protein [Vibrio parahaemolyticus]EHU0354344.1 hypothetical protein [Vibrio parahaemolyticus]